MMHRTITSIPAISAITATPTIIAADEGKPLIDWAALGKVAGVSLVFGIAVVVLFSLGVVGLSMARGTQAASGSVSGGSTAGSVATGSVGGDGAGGADRRVAGSLLAGVCFVACAGAVLYGLWLIVPQFH